MGKIVVLSYVDDCVYWYILEALGKLFVDTLEKRFHVKFIGFSHWFISVSISHIKDSYISVDQARYDTSILSKYLDTVIIKKQYKFL